MNSENSSTQPISEPSSLPNPSDLSLSPNEISPDGNESTPLPPVEVEIEVTEWRHVRFAGPDYAKMVDELEKGNKVLLRRKVVPNDR